MSAIQKVDNGLVIPGNITEEEHKALCRAEVGAEEDIQNKLKRCQWRIGDLYNSIPAGHGGRYGGKKGKAAYCKEVGFNPGTAANCGAVAAAFSISITSPRGDAIEMADKPHRTILNFRCHKAAANSTTDEQRTKLIESAIAAKHTEGEYWTSTRIDHERKKMLGIVDEVKIDKANSKSLVDAAIAALPKSTPKSVEPIVRKLIKQLGSQYHAELEAAVAERCKQERADHGKAMAEYNGKKAYYEKAIAGVTRPIELDEYRILRQFCHPDKHPDNYTKAGQAYAIVLAIGERLQLSKRRAGNG